MFFHGIEKKKEREREREKTGKEYTPSLCAQIYYVLYELQLHRQAISSSRTTLS